MCVIDRDIGIENLLDLDGARFVIDEFLGLWVKFEVKRTHKTFNRPHGIRYSLSLHNRKNIRIMGFDNAHAIEYGNKILPYDHWHRSSSDEGRLYYYENAIKLLEDFWYEVERIVKKLKEEIQ